MPFIGKGKYMCGFKASPIINMGSTCYSACYDASTVSSPNLIAKGLETMAAGYGDRSCQTTLGTDGE